MFTLHFTLCGSHIRVDYPSNDITRYLLTGLSGFVSEPSDSPTVRYTIRGDIDAGFVIEHPKEEPKSVIGYWKLLHCLEGYMAYSCGQQRPELFFMHGCTVALNNQAFLISAPSKNGKSTLTWALLHHGFDYISDDISPIDLTRLHVEPYPRGMSQRTNPAAPYSLPEQTLKIGKTLRIPVEALPCQVVKQPTPLAGVFFINYTPGTSVPSLTPLSVSESCMRFFANGLRQLDHENKGLTAAKEIAERIPGFKLEMADLGQTAKLLHECVLAL